MVKKSEILDAAKKCIQGDELDFFNNSLVNDKLNVVRRITEQNLANAKDELYRSARSEKCDSVIISHFKNSDELFTLVMDYFLQEFDNAGL